MRSEFAKSQQRSNPSKSLTAASTKRDLNSIAKTYSTAIKTVAPASKVKIEELGKSCHNTNTIAVAFLKQLYAEDRESFERMVHVLK